MTGFFADAQARYVEAVGRRDAIRDAWMRAGGELLATGSTGQLVEHPLVKMLREHDLLVDRLGRAAEKQSSHRGPVPSAVITPSIGKSPAAKRRRLKAVGE